MTDAAIVDDEVFLSTAACAARGLDPALDAIQIATTAALVVADPHCASRLRVIAELLEAEQAYLYARGSYRSTMSRHTIAWVRALPEKRVA